MQPKKEGKETLPVRDPRTPLCKTGAWQHHRPPPDGPDLCAVIRCRSPVLGRTACLSPGGGWASAPTEGNRHYPSREPPVCQEYGVRQRYTVAAADTGAHRASWMRAADGDAARFRFRTRVAGHFCPGRKHSLLPALATNMPPACLLNASRPRAVSLLTFFGHTKKASRRRHPPGSGA